MPAEVSRKTSFLQTNKFNVCGDMMLSEIKLYMFVKVFVFYEVFLSFPYCTKFTPFKSRGYIKSVKNFFEVVAHRRDSALKLYCFCMWPGGEPGQNAKPLYLPPAFLRRLFYAVKISLPSCNPSLTLLLPSALLVKPQYFFALAGCPFSYKKISARIV